MTKAGSRVTKRCEEGLILQHHRIHWNLNGSLTSLNEPSCPSVGWSVSKIYESRIKNKIELVYRNPLLPFFFLGLNTMYQLSKTIPRVVLTTIRGISEQLWH